MNNNRLIKRDFNYLFINGIYKNGIFYYFKIIYINKEVFFVNVINNNRIEFFYMKNINIKVII